jgi:hypothetical protein
LNKEKIKKKNKTTDDVVQYKCLTTYEKCGVKAAQHLRGLAGKQSLKVLEVHALLARAARVPDEGQ